MNRKTLVGALVLLLFARAVQAQAITNAIPGVARPLPLSAVRVTGGPLKRAQDLDAAYLLKLEPDRMMAYYRTRAGLQPKAEGYPGWDGDGRREASRNEIPSTNTYFGIAHSRRAERTALRVE